MTGEDKATEDRAVETRGGGEGMARPEQELGADRSVSVCCVL